MRNNAIYLINKKVNKSSQIVHHLGRVPNRGRAVQIDGA